jgi:hypothetical protein
MMMPVMPMAMPMNIDDVALRAGGKRRNGRGLRSGNGREDQRGNRTRKHHSKHAHSPCMRTKCSRKHNTKSASAVPQFLLFIDMNRKSELNY